MTDGDDSNSGREFSISRRKALGGLASIGAATTLGGAATFAQFTDTEEQVATFTAGGIDGTLVTNASYNGDQLTNEEVSDIVNFDGEGPGATIEFIDVKPGDYGSFNFTLEVTNNPAWVAACLGIGENRDYWNYEPEVESDNETDPIQENIPDGDFDAQASAGDSPDSGTGLNQPGELPQNTYIIPFYDSNPTSSFFDSGGAPSTVSVDTGQAVPSGFWDNSEGPNGQYAAQVGGDGDGFLAPRRLSAVVQEKFKNTIVFNSGGGEIYEPPEDTSLENGCIVLNGGGSADDTDNTQEAGPLKPGTTLNFGFDWHVPFTTGNEVMGDRMSVNAGFTFSQVRNAEGPEFQNTYAPGNN
jgi:predicted ribosomally synthesized peptide with SipW-like signal peptide